MRSLWELFDLDRRGSTPGTEVRAGVATFLTMSYILFANPDILAAAGVPKESAVACTAAAAGICSILMGLVANFPLALASGMGLNAIVAYGIASETKSWQAAMGLVVLDGLIVLLLVLLGFREKVMDAFPRDLRRAIGVGIGLFIAFIGFVNAKLVLVPAGTIAVLGKDPNASMPPVTAGSLRNPETAIAMLGLIVIAALMARGIKGAIPLGILASTLVALACGVTHLPQHFNSPSFSNFLQADMRGALHLHLVPALLALVMVDFFDTLGTATAIAEQAGLQDGRGRILGLRRILAVDGAAASIGGLFGASSVTAYIESAAGVAEGARTGLHSVVVGILFLFAIVLAPVAGVVPAAATAPALIVVGFLMCSEIGRIDFRNPETGIPAFITLAVLPFTYSISHGVGYGLLTFTAIKLVRGKIREVHPVVLVIALAFAAYFIAGA